MTIVNDDFSVINKLGASLTDDAGVIIYDRDMFIVQATGYRIFFNLSVIIVKQGVPVLNCLKCCQIQKKHFSLKVGH
jgi:hypothetical protein